MDLEDKTKQLLEKHKIRLIREYDQHFLIDEQVINEIIKSAHIKKEDIILEIGPGTASLTEKLAHKAKVIAVEIDKQFNKIVSDWGASNRIEDITDFYQELSALRFTYMAISCTHEILNGLKQLINYLVK